MKELKVGMYVRFNYHRVTVPIQIAKIKEKYYDEMEKYYYYLTDNGLIISEENIIKPSENILDLIEPGDYVNGKRVYNISIVDGLKYLDVEVEDYLSDTPFINADQITSIVTKEQFSSVKYEVE